MPPSICGPAKCWPWSANRARARVTRSATIIGIVGAGGIGLFLAERIRTFKWDQVAFIVLMILLTVALIDWVSTRLRIALVGKRNLTL